MPPSTKSGPCPTFTDDVLTEALRLRSLGLSIIPVWKEKQPAIKAWKPFQTVAADECQVRDWFDRRDDLGLAIILGDVSGHLIARDFDVRDSWQRWAGEYPKLEQMLPAVETSRGRKHVYARIVGCPAITYEDGELRAHGQYVVAPPSLHPSGCRYRWGRGFDSLADVPKLTLDESGFGRCWNPSDEQPESMPQIGTESVSVRSVPICPYLWHGADIIHGTIPTAYGQRRKRLFELARRVHSHPQLQDVPIHELRPLVEEWHRLALPNIRTTCLDESWMDFIDAHHNVDADRCEDATLQALSRSDAKEPPPEAARYVTPQTRRLVGLCRELSSLSPDGVFYLSCRKAANVLGTADHKAIARVMQMLVTDGVLIEVVKGGPATNKATRYRWKGRA